MGRTPAEEAFIGAVKLASELKPGDIVLMTPKPRQEGMGFLPSLASRAFVAVSKDLQGDKTHSAIYVGNGEVVEARMESGITKKKLTDALQGIQATVVRPIASAKERSAAARRALQMHREGVRYDLAGLGRALVQELGIPTREKKKLDAVTCSTLISNSYTKPLVDKPKDSVMPADFLRTDKTTVVTNLGGTNATSR